MPGPMDTPEEPRARTHPAPAPPAGQATDIDLAELARTALQACLRAASHRRAVLALDIGDDVPPCVHTAARPLQGRLAHLMVCALGASTRRQVVLRIRCDPAQVRVGEGLIPLRFDIGCLLPTARELQVARAAAFELAPPARPPDAGADDTLGLPIDVSLAADGRPVLSFGLHAAPAQGQHGVAAVARRGRPATLHFLPLGGR